VGMGHPRSLSADTVTPDLLSTIHCSPIRLSTNKTPMRDKQRQSLAALNVKE